MREIFDAERGGAHVVKGETSRKENGRFPKFRSLYQQASYLKKKKLFRLAGRSLNEKAVWAVDAA